MKKRNDLTNFLMQKVISYTWTSSYWTAKSSFFLTSDQPEACYLGPKFHPGHSASKWWLRWRFSQNCN